MTELFQEIDVAGAAVAEGESLADADADQPAQIADEIADERGGIELTEGLVKGDDDRGVEAEPFEQCEAVFEGLEGGRGAVRGQGMVGVPVKGDGDG